MVGIAKIIIWWNCTVSAYMYIIWHEDGILAYFFYVAMTMSLITHQIFRQHIVTTIAYSNTPGTHTPTHTPIPPPIHVCSTCRCTCAQVSLHPSHTLGVWSFNTSRHQLPHKGESKDHVGHVECLLLVEGGMIPSSRSSVARGRNLPTQMCLSLVSASCGRDLWVESWMPTNKEM